MRHKMEIEASAYDRSNGPQKREALEMIDNIIKEFPHGGLDIIVDIGCGSGNVTHLLGKCIPHKRILAFDIDPKMVEFAANNYKEDDIEFLEQDIAQPWHLLNPKIKALEGTVNLIFTNFVLHWIKDKTLAFQNIYRLLKPGGVIHFTVAVLKSIDNFIELKDRNAFDKCYRMDSPETQITKIIFDFRQAGFLNVVSNPKMDQFYEFETVEIAQSFLKLAGNNCLKLGLISQDIIEAEEALVLKIEKLVWKAYSSKSEELTSEQICEDQTIIFNHSLGGRAQKRGNVKICL